MNGQAICCHQGSISGGLSTSIRSPGWTAMLVILWGPFQGVIRKVVSGTRVRWRPDPRTAGIHTRTGSSAESVER